MPNFAVVAAAGVLVLHGLIHLMGVSVYMKLGHVGALNYKTTLLDGHWNVGERGVYVFGALWLVCASGFVLSAVALLTGAQWHLPLLIAVTSLSLVITSLDYSVAFAGAFTNLIIFGVILLPSSPLR